MIDDARQLFGECRHERHVEDAVAAGGQHQQTEALPTHRKRRRGGDVATPSQPIEGARPGVIERILDSHGWVDGAGQGEQLRRVFKSLREADGRRQAHLAAGTAGEADRSCGRDARAFERLHGVTRRHLDRSRSGELAWQHSQRRRALT